MIYHKMVLGIKHKHQHIQINMKRTTLLKLRKVYYDLKHPESFSSINRLLKYAKTIDDKVKRTDIEDFLSKQDVYTLHKPLRHRFRRRKILARHIGHIFAADLIDVKKIRKENFGRKYILIMIDVFSRYAYAAAMKNKTGNETLRAIRDIFSQARTPPLKIFADKGREFYNKTVKKYLKSKRILLYSTENETKASIVERFIRSFKSRLFKIFTARNSLNYTSIIDDVMLGLNNRYHRGIGRAPSEVNKRNQREVHEFQYGKYLRSRKRQPKFKIGDTVRISRERLAFRKGYLKTFSDNLFRIVDVLHTQPTTYRIVAESSNEVILGTWYESELCRSNRNM